MSVLELEYGPCMLNGARPLLMKLTKLLLQ